MRDVPHLLDFRFRKAANFELFSLPYYMLQA